MLYGMIITIVKTMKKIAIILLALTTPFIFAACGSPDQNPKLSQEVSFRTAQTTPSPTDILGSNTADTSTSPPSTAPQNTIQSSSPAPDQSAPQKQLVEAKGPGMKTLQDFTPITAKEVTITTSKGDITFTVFADKVPLTVTNFLTLAKSGFYNGIKFHRIIPDFMAQVGDPLTKDDSKKELWGTGGPGYTIADEFDPSLKHDTEGTVSMANTGQPNTGGSQIFITYAATPWLDGHHAVFGKVTQGMEVLRKLEVGDQIVSISFK